MRQNHRIACKSCELVSNRVHVYTVWCPLIPPFFLLPRLDVSDFSTFCFVSLHFYKSLRLCLSVRLIVHLCICLSICPTIYWCGVMISLPHKMKLSETRLFKKSFFKGGWITHRCIQYNNVHINDFSSYFVLLNEFTFQNWFIR